MINKHNIIDYIQFLYKQKYMDAAPAQLLSHWRNVSENDIAKELQNLYQHWAWDSMESARQENNFLQQYTKPIVNTAATSPIKNIVQNPIPFPAKKTSSYAALLWILPVLVLALAAFGYYVYSNSASKNEIITEKTTGTLAAPKPEDEDDEIYDIVMEENPADTIVNDIEEAVDADPLSAAVASDGNADAMNINTIRNFVNAEDERDFSAIEKYFSPNIVSYWDMNYPTSNQLRNRYESIWNKTSDNDNTVDRIEKIGDKTYEMFGEYSYYGIKTGENYKIKTHILFVLDDNHKIIKTHGL